MFDSDLMAYDRPGPAADRLLVARLTGIAQRHARWGAIGEDEAAAGAAELRDVTNGRADLLAEVAGLAIGAAEIRGREYQARGHAVAGLCRLAGADEQAIPAWIEEESAGSGRGARPRSASRVDVHCGAADRGCQPAQHGPEPQTWQQPARVIPPQRRTGLLERLRQASLVCAAVRVDSSRLHDLSTEIWVHCVLPRNSALAPW